MKPLAYRIRPTSFSDVVGQDHLVGENGIITKMLKNDKLVSFILYGKAGTGKTTIALILKEMFPLNSFLFNASTDSKQTLKEIVDATNFYENVIVIIDEIHRLKKDTQDYLLPYLENGKIIMVGLTTENPYRTINPAIRSRLHIYKLNEITPSDLKKLLFKVSEKEKIKVTEEIIDYIVMASSLEIRTALNMLEISSLIDEKDRTLDKVKEIIGVKNIAIDQNGENYYDILSALIKSIRGSDVDASLHYLARFLKCEDLEMITRRLLISSYEDIGFGNLDAAVQVNTLNEMRKNFPYDDGDQPMYFIHAIRVLCASEKDRSSDYLKNIVIKSFAMGKKIEIPDIALDKHTRRGKLMGRGSKHFFEEATKVIPQLKIDNDYRERYGQILEVYKPEDAVPNAFQYGPDQY